MGPCHDLISADDVLSCCSPDQFDGDHPPSDAALADAAAAASQVAWRLGGRQHGVCDTHGERPGRLNRANRCSGLAQPARTPAGWVNTGCSCRPASVATLAHTPVVAVTDVRIGGESLDPTAYAVVAPNRLVRRDGGAWPACQLLDSHDDGDGVLVVDYTWGVAMGAYDRHAVAAFACELVKACLDRPCALPSRVTTLTRQGVSMTLVDPMEFLDEGRTGVYQFDVWLGQVNPNGRHGRSRVRTPDVSRPAGGSAAAAGT